MIFTSYFAQVKKLKLAGIVPVSIARYNPDWFEGRTLIDLAPTSNMLKMDYATYDRFYHQILFKLKAENIIEKIKKLGDGRQVALLCYEANLKECHRDMVRQWLVDAGFRVEEFGAAEKSREDQESTVEIVLIMTKEAKRARIDELRSQQKTLALEALRIMQDHYPETEDESTKQERAIRALMMSFEVTKLQTEIDVVRAQPIKQKS